MLLPPSRPRTAITPRKHKAPSRRQARPPRATAGERQLSTQDPRARHARGRHRPPPSVRPPSPASLFGLLPALVAALRDVRAHHHERRQLREHVVLVRAALLRLGRAAARGGALVERVAAVEVADVGVDARRRHHQVRVPLRRLDVLVVRRLDDLRPDTVHGRDRAVALGARVAREAAHEARVLVAIDEDAEVAPVAQLL
mmetsp:Transcript_30864/g.81783  ORF Transcript_30864/g.81783 Transcript_30864/m.81783 type:complete len:200 (-) Transcript_30864:651-1250(-)